MSNTVPTQNEPRDPARAVIDDALVTVDRALGELFRLRAKLRDLANGGAR